MNTTDEQIFEGKCARELGKYKLQKYLGEDVADPRENLSFYSADMDNAVDYYVKVCVEEYERMKTSCRDLLTFAGKQVQYGRLDRYGSGRAYSRRFIPYGEGVVDCVIIGAGEMAVVIFEYGDKAAVDAEDDRQLKLYALGSLLAFDGYYDISVVKRCVVQPRLDNVSAITVFKESLYQWGEEIEKSEDE